MCKHSGVFVAVNVVRSSHCKGIPGQTGSLSLYVLFSYIWGCLLTDRLERKHKKPVLDLDVTALLAATAGYMPAAGGAIARGLCDCVNSRQEMLMRSEPFARVLSASVQMISVKRLAMA